jgi:CRISPR-associated endonuclease/helicase Cas3
MGRLHRHDRPNRPGTGPEIWISIPTIPADGSAKTLREALGKSAYVYAPYVLLRSWQQWRSRQAITLPDDIRAILEATYAEAPPTEPAAWVELHEDLERRKAELSATALNATQVWCQPSLADDEGVQTRYSTRPTASLLVVREIAKVDSLTARLTLLDGTTVTASGRDWNIDTARAIHRNLVRMPRWAVLASLGGEPEWLRLHVTESAAIGLLQDDGTLKFSDSDNQTGLSYCRERGILIAPRTLSTTTRQETRNNEDESYD